MAQSATTTSPAAEVAERVHREGGYASELPVDADGIGSPVHTPPEPRATPMRNGRSGSGSSPALAYLIAGAVIAALVVLFTMLLVRFRPRVAAGEAEPAAPRPRSSDATNEPAIPAVAGDPDELAAEGRFEDALAALLWRALTAVGWEPHGRARAATAREVLSDLGADHPGCEPLAGVVQTQERVAFGGEPANRERYDEARRWFVELGRRSER